MSTISGARLEEAPSAHAKSQRHPAQLSHCTSIVRAICQHVDKPLPLLTTKPDPRGTGNAAPPNANRVTPEDVVLERAP